MPVSEDKRRLNVRREKERKGKKEKNEPVTLPHA